MTDFALTEIFFLSLLALILLGPEQLIRFMRSLGSWWSKVKFQGELYREYLHFQFLNDSLESSQPSSIQKYYDPHIVLYQPEIAQNVGTIARMAACLDIKLDIIEPCGFIWNNQKMQRAGMDYLDQAVIIKHDDYNSIMATYPERRIVLVDTKGETDFFNFEFEPSDLLMFGRESDGIPDEIYTTIHHRIKIPMKKGRSLNLAVASAMVVAEFLSQIKKYDDASFTTTDASKMV